MLKKLLALILLLTPALCAAKPVEPSLRMLPLSMRLKLPLFQVVGSGAIGSGAGSGGGGGGGGGFPDPGSNGILARTSLGIATPRTITAGVGVLVTNGDGVSGNPTLDYDSAIIPNYSSGTATPSASCSAGTLYFETDRDALWSCSHTDTWTDLSVPLASRVSGVIPIANLATGTPDGTKFIKDDGTLAVPAGGSTFDPSTTLDYTEEFVSGGNTTAAFGANGLIVGVTATGTTALNVAETSMTRHPGMARLNSHVSGDNSGAAIQWSAAGGSNQLSLPWYDNDWDLDAVVLNGSNSTAITNNAFAFGLSNNASTADMSAASREIVIRRDTDLSETGAWTFVTCNASGAAGCNSAADAANANIHLSTITPASGTWDRLRIYRRAVGVGGIATVYFQANDETPISFCASGCDEPDSHIPTSGTMNFFVQALTRTTTGVLSSDIDYMRVKITFGAARY